MTNTQNYKMQYTPSEIASLCELLADCTRDTKDKIAFTAMRDGIALAFALGRATHSHAAIDFGAFFRDIEEGARDLYMQPLQEHLATEPYSLLDQAKKLYGDKET